MSVQVVTETWQVTVDEGPGSVVEVLEDSHDAAVVVVSDAPAGPQGPQGDAGPAGPDGPQGPQGTSGGDFTFAQGAPAAVWTITHNLGFHPNITVEDSGGSEVEGEIAYSNVNTVVLTFSAAFSGVAYLS